MALTRPIEPMPEDVAKRLAEAGLTAAYDARPPYQRNDYLRWINGARRAETRERRIAQMLDELTRGGVYMAMTWKDG
ncbi:MAG: YdeI/OmpD-associated family protein [Pseudomonadota bacterium]|nr:YdeI/OmpD-associated family protein [Pseudomonadota bacterium]